MIGGFPGSSDGNASAYNAGDLGSIPGSGRPPGEGNGNPTQYSCLESPMDRERSLVGIIRGVAESDTTNTHTGTHTDTHTWRNKMWQSVNED